MRCAVCRKLRCINLEALQAKPRAVIGKQHDFPQGHVCYLTLKGPAVLRQVCARQSPPAAEFDEPGWPWPMFCALGNVPALPWLQGFHFTNRHAGWAAFSVVVLCHWMLKPRSRETLLPTLPHTPGWSPHAKVKPDTRPADRPFYVL